MDCMWPCRRNEDIFRRARPTRNTTPGLPPPSSVFSQKISFRPMQLETGERFSKSSSHHSASDHSKKPSRYPTMALSLRRSRRAPKRLSEYNDGDVVEVSDEDSFIVSMDYSARSIASLNCSMTRRAFSFCRDRQM
jgi:hypothetical protein